MKWEIGGLTFCNVGGGCIAAVLPDKRSIIAMAYDDDRYVAYLLDPEGKMIGPARQACAETDENGNIPDPYPEEILTLADMEGGCKVWLSQFDPKEE
jgi:hypothetical protein